MSDVKDTSTGERLQKLIAQAGITSRRDAETLIREGSVTVNGKTAKLGDKATLGVDAIKVKGKLIHVATTKVYYLFYKPKNVIAMIAEDEEGRPTLKDFLKRIKERVFTTGRMDFTGEGAILLTNDGEMAQKLQKSTDIIRKYHVKVDRQPTQDELARLARGGRIEGRSMHPYHVRVVENYTRNALIEISFEGMGSIDIRQYFENKGFFPEKIARVGIGHISAERMQPGAIKKLNPSSVAALFTQPELTKKIIDRSIESKGVKRHVLADDRSEKRILAGDDTSAPGFATGKARAPVGRGLSGAGAPLPKNSPKYPATRPSAKEIRKETRARAPRTDDAQTARPTTGRTLRPISSAGGYASARPARKDTRPPSRTDRPARSTEGRPARPPSRTDRPARSFSDRPVRTEPSARFEMPRHGRDEGGRSESTRSESRFNQAKPSRSTPRSAAFISGSGDKPTRGAPRGDSRGKRPPSRFKRA